MKRIIALIVTCSLFFVACSNSYNSTNITDASSNTDNTAYDDETFSSIGYATELNEAMLDSLRNENVDYDSFNSLSDPELLSYVEDNIYATLEENLASDDYEVVNVNAIYISQEYIDELEYNSRKNIYFGYTAEEITEQFDDTPYYFTLGDDGTTVVRTIEPREDHYDEIVRNVAIGAGIILICVTVSVLSGGTLAGPSAVAGTSLIHSIFATAALSAGEYALLNGAISGVVSGVIEGYRTGDYQEAIDAGVLAGSNGLKWGAITGAIFGGISAFVKAPAWMKTPEGRPTWRQSEIDITNSLNAEEQVSFLAGEEVDLFTPGATRPDGIIRMPDGSVKAIEIKNYNLKTNLSQLASELRRQVSQRMVDLPSGSTQEIILDARGRGYSAETLNHVVEYLRNALNDIYPNIQITFYGG